MSCSPHITIGAQICLYACLPWTRYYEYAVFAHALPMITASLSSATLSCLALPVVHTCVHTMVHTYNVQSNISFISRPRGEREKRGYSIEYVICFLLMQGARVEAGEAEGNKAVQR